MEAGHGRKLQTDFANFRPELALAQVRTMENRVTIRQVSTSARNVLNPSFQNHAPNLTDSLNEALLVEEETERVTKQKGTGKKGIPRKKYLLTAMLDREMSTVLTSFPISKFPQKYFEDPMLEVSTRMLKGSHAPKLCE